MASLKDLNEVKASMEGLLNFRDMCDDHPVGLIAMNGHLKLMELLFHTDFDFHQRGFYNPFKVACEEGSTEIVKLMVNSFKEFGIELLMPEISMEILVLCMLAWKATQKL